MMPSAGSLELHSRWASRRYRIRRCCERSKSWELASCPSSTENSPQPLRVPDATLVAPSTPAHEAGVLLHYPQPEAPLNRTVAVPRLHSISLIKHRMFLLDQTD